MPEGRRLLPRCLSAATAPSSNFRDPLDRSVKAIQCFRLGSRLRRGRNRVPASVPRKASASRPGRSPLRINVATPYSAAFLAASILVAIPPVPPKLRDEPARPSISGVISSTRGISVAEGSTLGSVVKRPSTSDRMTSRSASTRCDTCPASESLSPRRISSTETVSFSLMIGITPSSMSVVKVCLALRNKRRSANS